MSVSVGEAVGYLDLDISGFLSNLKTAQAQANSVTGSMATTVGANLTSAGKSLTSAGTTLTKTFTVPITAAGAAAVKLTSDFDSSMSKVSAISGATGGDLDALRQKAKDMGAQTKFSASESAQAFTYMAMAGWKTEDMLEGIDGVMALAAADGLDLATTSDIVTDGLTAFGLSAKDAGHFADVLAQTGRNANTNVSMLGESFKYVAPVAGALGYSVEDCSIALGLMANSGIKASQGGTALRTMLTNLAKPTDQMAEAMDYLGISLQNDDGSMKSLMDVMKDLRGSFGDIQMPMDEFQSQLSDIQAKYESGELSESKYNEALEDLTEKAYGAEGALKAKYAATLAGKTGMAGLLAIVNTGEDDFNNLADAIYNSDGAAQEMADTMLDNLGGQLTLLKSALEGLAISIGEILMPYIRKFVEWLQNLVDKLNSLDESQKKQIVTIALVIAAIGPMLVVIGKVITGIGNLFTAIGSISKVASAAKTTFSALGTMIGGISAPVVAVIAVIAVLAAAFTHLWKTNEEFRNKMTAIWEGIKSKFEAFGQGIVERLNALGFDFENFGEVVKAIWEGFCNLLAPLFEGVFQQISNILGAALDVLMGIFDVFIGIFTGDWDKAWTGVKEIFGAVWNLIKNTFQNYLNVMKGVLDVVCGWFGTTWEATWNKIKEFFVNIWNNITNFFSNVINGIKTAVSNFVTTIINFFAQLPVNIKNFITNAYNAVVTWVSNMIAKAREMGQNFLNAVVEFFTDLPYKVGYFIGNTLANIVIWVSNMVAKAKEMGTNFLNQVVAFFTQLPGKVLQFITSAFNNVQTWATNMVNKAKEMGTNFINQVVSFFTQLPGKILQFLTSAINNVTTWVSNMKTKATEAAQGFLNNVVNTITNLPSKIKQYLDSAINNCTTWVSQMKQKGKDAITELINGVTSAASGIADKVKSIGSDIVNGVWNGIKAAKDTFVANVKSFFSGIVDGVKDALGIGSPSKVFRDEVGQWLPAGVAVGFEGAMPAAMKSIQSSLDDGIEDLSADADMETLVDAETFADRLQSMYNQLAFWFESIESRMHNSINNMTKDLAYLIEQGRVVANADGTLGYVGYNGFSGMPIGNRSVDNSGKSGYNNSGDGDTFIFYSNKDIDEIEAARQMRKTKRDMAEGF